MTQFKTLEGAQVNEEFSLEQVLASLQFNEQGLIPAIAQSHSTQEVLMMAWMNLEAIQKTLSTKDVWYWSRSRQKMWRKGESSGHTQTLRALRIDCDGDTLLLEVEQTGPACHTNRANCFYLTVQDNAVTCTHAPSL